MQNVYAFACLSPSIMALHIHLTNDCTFFTFIYINVRPMQTTYLQCLNNPRGFALDLYLLEKNEMLKGLFLYIYENLP